jgi:hypothetical protein
VGYSSEGAAGLFGRVEQIRFDEITLGPILKSAAIRALSTPPEEAQKPTVESSSWLAAVTERLDKLERERLRERDETAERFSTASAKIASDAAHDRQLRTRVEIVDALDSLRRGLKMRTTSESEPFCARFSSPTRVICTTPRSTSSALCIVS